MEIRKSTGKDLNNIIKIWDAAVEMQKFKTSGLTWHQFPEIIVKEIEKGMHYKIIDDDGKIMVFFSLTKSDAPIWGEKEKGDALYLHRIVSNLEFKGMGFTNLILRWGLTKTILSKRKFLRMDTWADNEKLVNYYTRCGFNLIGYKKLTNDPKLLPHYRTTKVALFENKI